MLKLNHEFQLGDYKGVEVEKVDETVNEEVVEC